MRNGEIVRRSLLIGLGALFVLAAVVPLIILGQRANQLANSSAYQSLSALVLAHNGESGYDATAAKTMRAATVVSVTPIATTYAMRDGSGVCWSVAVPHSGRATHLPTQAPSTWCR